MMNVWFNWPPPQGCEQGPIFTYDPLQLVAKRVRVNSDDIVINTQKVKMKTLRRELYRRGTTNLISKNPEAFEKTENIKVQLIKRLIYPLTSTIAEPQLEWCFLVGNNNNKVSKRRHSDSASNYTLLDTQTDTTADPWSVDNHLYGTGL